MLVMTPRTDALIDSAVNDEAALLHAHMAYCKLERENIELVAALEALREQMHAHFRLNVRKHYGLLVADAAAGTAIAKTLV